MNKKTIFCLAFAGLAMAACGSQNGYRSSGKGNVQSLKPSQTTAMSESESVALEMLNADKAYQAVKDTVGSRQLKNDLSGLQIETLNMKTENATISVLQFSYLEKSSNDCVPTDIKTMSYSKEALLKGVTINNFGRLQCVDEECNDLLLIIDKGLSEKHVSTAVRLSRDESGIYKPAKNESSTFADATSLDQAVEQCQTGIENIKKTYTEYGKSRQEGAKALSQGASTSSEGIKKAYQDYGKSRLQGQEAAKTEVVNPISDLESKKTPGGDSKDDPRR